MSAFVLKLIKPICSFLSYHQHSISRTVFMLGDLDIEWATTPSLQRSTTGERQGLVPPALNSVASV